MTRFAILITLAALAGNAGAEHWEYTEWEDDFTDEKRRGALLWVGEDRMVAVICFGLTLNTGH